MCIHGDMVAWNQLPLVQTVIPIKELLSVLIVTHTVYLHLVETNPLIQILELSSNTKQLEPFDWNKEDVLKIPKYRKLYGAMSPVSEVSECSSSGSGIFFVSQIVCKISAKSVTCCPSGGWLDMEWPTKQIPKNRFWSLILCG